MGNDCVNVLRGDTGILSVRRAIKASAVMSTARDKDSTGITPLYGDAEGILQLNRKYGGILERNRTHENVGE